MSEVLATRVAALEQEVEGEKLVTRHVLEQTRRNGDDLAAMRGQLSRMEARLDRIEGRIGKVEGRIGGVESRLDRVDVELRGLRSDLPTIVAETMREVLRERDR